MRSSLPRTVRRRAGWLALTVALSACGTVMPGSSSSTDPASGKRPSDQSAATLLTVEVAPGVSEAALASAFPDGQVLLFSASKGQAASGQAVVSLPPQAASGSTAPLQAASLNTPKLGALGLRVNAVETDATVRVQNYAEGMSVTTWAGGMTTWAGSVTTWAGGLTAMTTTSQNELKAYWSRLNLTAAHQLVPEQGAGVTVAVLDTGADLSHPLLRSQLVIMPSSDYIDGDSIPQEVWPYRGVSYYGHGTGVAGIVLQIAPKARIMPYRVLNANGEGSVSRVVQAMGRAVSNGADIINLSMGVMTDSTALNTAIADALSKGVVVVNSSGNLGAEGMLYPARKIGTSRFPTNAGLVGVGSVTMNLYKSSFTSYGSNMSLTVPGEQITTAAPNGGLMRASGTSFSAPAVAGALALGMSAGVRDLPTLVSGLRSSTTPNLDTLYRYKLGTGTLNVGSFMDKFR